MNIDKTNLLLTIILLILVVCNLSLYSNKILSPTLHNKEIAKQYEENEKQKKIDTEAEAQAKAEEEAAWTEEAMEEARLLDLKSKGEADRMYTYFYNYITLVEGGEYEEAYSKLYEEFKTQYFPTLDEYIEYVKQRYPLFIATQYKGIERQGEYYILTVEIWDSIAKENISILTQKFVMHEKGFNDYEISFQVI